MRQCQTILLPLIWISVSLTLSGCHSVAGNVIPAEGPTMESIYDDMGQRHTSMLYEGVNADVSSTPVANTPLPVPNNTDLLNDQTREKATTTPIIPAIDFEKIPNPPLILYVFPHLSGQSRLPIPGYTTVFSAYTQDHYALPLVTKLKKPRPPEGVSS